MEDSFLRVSAWIVIIVFLVLIIRSIVRSALAESIVVKAKVVSMNVNTTPFFNMTKGYARTFGSATSYIVEFETLKKKNKLRLNVDSDLYSQLKEGQRGILTYCENKVELFVKFN